MTVAFCYVLIWPFLGVCAGRGKTWHLFVFFFYWGIVAFQYCVSFCFMAEWTIHTHTHTHTFPGGTSGKNPPANAGDTRDVGSIPGLGTSPGVGIGNLLQYLCLENSMNREEFPVLYNQFSSVIYFVHSSAHMWPSKVRGGGLEKLPHELKHVNVGYLR